MKAASDYLVVLVTAPERRTARKLVRLALEARLVACGNIISGLESHYWWQGKIETSPEVLILFKTTKQALGSLEELVLADHPYDTPEIITAVLDQGTTRYLDWISKSVTNSKSATDPSRQRAAGKSRNQSMGRKHSAA